MLARTDDLAIEAAKLLIARRGAVAVASRALEAAHEPLRTPGGQLAGRRVRQGPGRPRARSAGALSSRYQAVREAAAFELASQEGPRRLRVPGGDPRRRLRRRTSSNGSSR